MRIKKSKLPLAFARRLQSTSDCTRILGERKEEVGEDSRMLLPHIAQLYELRLSMHDSSETKEI